MSHNGNKVWFVQQLDKPKSLSLFSPATVETAIQALKKSADCRVPDYEEFFMRTLCHVISKIKSDLGNVSGHSGCERSNSIPLGLYSV